MGLRYHNVCSFTTGSFVSSSTDLKDKEEDVNDVNVKGERSIDVLLWTDGQLPVSDK